MGQESLVPSLELSPRDPRLEGKKLASCETSRPRDPLRSRKRGRSLNQTLGRAVSRSHGGRREGGDVARGDVVGDDTAWLGEETWPEATWPGKEKRLEVTRGVSRPQTVCLIYR